MIDVALTPVEMRPAGIAVVIDVLRATSTATQALAAGYHRVLCVDSVERAVELRAPGRVLAGERHNLMPPGFDQGNSPAEVIDVRGDELVLATTNGAPAIVAATAHAPVVLIACLLNLRAVVESLAAAGGDVQIVCSGTDGAAALEDVYVAGRVSSGLSGPRTDAALVAEAVARAHPSPLDALGASADASRLRAVGLDADIEYCARESRLDVVPRVLSASGSVATLASTGEQAGARTDRTPPASSHA